MEEEIKKSDNYKDLVNMVSKWQTGFVLSRAILDDYTKEMSKLTGVDAQVIKDRIEKDATRRLNESKQNH